MFKEEEDAPTKDGMQESPFYWRISEVITGLSIVWIGICIVRYGKVEK